MTKRHSQLINYKSDNLFTPPKMNCKYTTNWKKLVYIINYHNEWFCTCVFLNHCKLPKQFNLYIFQVFYTYKSSLSFLYFAAVFFHDALKFFTLLTLLILENIILSYTKANNYQMMN